MFSLCSFQHAAVLCSRGWAADCWYICVCVCVCVFLRTCYNSASSYTLSVRFCDVIFLFLICHSSITTTVNFEGQLQDKCKEHVVWKRSAVNLQHGCVYRRESGRVPASGGTSHFASCLQKAACWACPLPGRYPLLNSFSVHRGPNASLLCSLQK